MFSIFSEQALSPLWAFFALPYRTLPHTTLLPTRSHIQARPMLRFHISLSHCAVSIPAFPFSKSELFSTTTLDLPSLGYLSFEFPGISPPHCFLISCQNQLFPPPIDLHPFFSFGSYSPKSSLWRFSVDLLSDYWTGESPCSPSFSVFPLTHGHLSSFDPSLRTSRVSKSQLLFTSCPLLFPWRHTFVCVSFSSRTARMEVGFSLTFFCVDLLPLGQLAIDSQFLLSPKDQSFFHQAFCYFRTSLPSPLTFHLPSTFSPDFFSRFPLALPPTVF